MPRCPSPARLRLVALIGFAMLWTTGAHAAEKLAVVPLNALGDIPPAIAEGFRTHLRGLAASKADVIDQGAVEAAMGRVGVTPNCSDAGCAGQLGAEIGARFVLSGQVANTDEIYKVRLYLYDTAAGKITGTADGDCELCAAEEVDRTISASFAKLQAALSAAPPAAAAPTPTPAAEGRIAVQITTIPDGADITVDGKPAGKSPIVVKVEPGPHVITAQKPGTKLAERTVSALDRTIKLAFKLQTDPDYVAAPTPPVAAPTPPVATPTPAPVPTPPVIDDPATDTGYTITGAGMLVGGAILTAGGIYATWIDGEITCTDGLGRRECPTVYNTKGVGMTALGLGAGLIGAGLTLIIVDALDGDSAAALVPTADGAAFTFGGRF